MHPLYGVPIVPTQVSPEYLRVTMYGADFERAVGDFVFRGEMAWLANGNRQQVNWADDQSLLLKYPNGTADAQKRCNTCWALTRMIFSSGICM